MTHRTFAFPVLLLTSLSLLLACGGDDDDAKTPATCAAICAQQNSLCKTMDDCDTICSRLAQLVTKSGCDTEYQEGLDCLSEKNVCDEDETACPGESFFSCLSTFCAAPANAAEPVCAQL